MYENVSLLSLGFTTKKTNKFERFLCILDYFQTCPLSMDQGGYIIYPPCHGPIRPT